MGKVTLGTGLSAPSYQWNSFQLLIGFIFGNFIFLPTVIPLGLN